MFLKFNLSILSLYSLHFGILFEKIQFPYLGNPLMSNRATLSDKHSALLLLSKADESWVLRTNEKYKYKTQIIDLSHIKRNKKRKISSICSNGKCKIDRKTPTIQICTIVLIEHIRQGD